MNVHLLSTSLSPGSRSRSLLDDVACRLDAMGVQVETTDARDLPPALCDGSPLSAYPVAYQIVADRLRRADGVIVAVPIYLFSASGVAKNLLDIVSGALEAAPVGIVSAAGSSRSHLAIGSLIVTLVLDCRAWVYPGTIQAAGHGRDGDYAQRVLDFATGFVQHVASHCRASASAS